jgi:hypothetical protein
VQGDHSFHIEQGVSDDDVPVRPVRHEHRLGDTQRRTGGWVPR